ncbi:LPS export ABC transporter ATP-binding protein [Brytella acorum]|uniref:Lipopolysaccharide export system ATP-binding protein LptB n=1 Tax=Brytella acorum TaxID=2959299 RepID=A0AA35V267_9PROT|nr:LPS export ABC transporter ATP-binding protein [Brytella acorum]MDF3625832.1 LPS export ABC transporter ATP-binding protein [Brytella acorum]CAI9121260.1 LPS export ABC transporter ATP-binding protein [Brytella acorum]
MLSAHRIMKSWGKRTVIRDVSLTVRRGEIVGLLGPNGAGKSTTFRMLTGELMPDGGNVALDGADVTYLPFYERARYGLAYLPQTSFLPRTMTVEQAIAVVLETSTDNGPARARHMERVLTDFSLASLRGARVGSLSGGQRRRCEIAISMACNPTFALLDEPFAGVDPVNVREIATLIRAMTHGHVGVLITDHSALELLRLVDRAYVICDGHVLAEGDAATLVADRRVREAYLGGAFQI